MLRCIIILLIFLKAKSKTFFESIASIWITPQNTAEKGNVMMLGSKGANVENCNLVYSVLK